ncbi:MAG: beta-propeller fold lactonase family protein [Isosphaeraceae bacterium]
MTRRLAKTLLAACFLLAAAPAQVSAQLLDDTAVFSAAGGALLNPSVGVVFVGTNHNNTKDSTQPANQVAVYNRAADGRLTLLGYFNTGGQGSGPSIRFAGDGLGSSHSIQLTPDRKFLLVTNAGSNNISVFHVLREGLNLTDIAPTGAFPNSVSIRNRLVYVLCSAGAGSISGYTLNDRGKLTPLSNSTRFLQANQDPVRPDTLFNPTQVSITPDGKWLVVTIKDGPAPGALPGVTPTGPGRILVFALDKNGRPSQRFAQTNLNFRGPFGFSFARNGDILSALFVGGPNLTAAAGSFRIRHDGILVQTSQVNNTQLDSCWFENNGKYGWTSNYTSGTISSYSIGHDGRLQLLQAVAGTTDPSPNRQGSTPLDLGVSPDGRFLYNVLPGSGKVAGWRINGNGSLTKIGEFGGLPITVDGDSAPEEYGPGGSPAGIAVL